jgi:hypothetical protein
VQFIIGAFLSEPAGSDTSQLSSIVAKGAKQLQYLHVMESQLASIKISGIISAHHYRNSQLPNQSN